MPRLYYLLRGIKRTKGSCHQLPLRKPITIAHLTSILSWLQCSLLSTHDRQLWWSSCTAPTTRTTLPGFTLSTTDIRFGADSSMFLFIKASKIDPFKLGCTIRISSTGNRFCLVNALRVFLRTCSSSSPVPLFVFSDGSFLTRQHMSTFLSSILQETDLNIVSR